MECLQHERVRIFQNKTSIERQSFMRICKLDAKYPGVVQYLWGAVPDIRNCSAYESHCLLRSKMGTQSVLCGKSVV